MSTNLVITSKIVKELNTHINVAGSTNTGLVRNSNQDSYFIDSFPQGVLAVVADGMGGHKDGEIASEIATEIVAESFKNIKEIPPVIIGQAVQAANLNICDYSDEKLGHQGMGTTLTIVFLDDQIGFVGHIGDSRAYLIRNGKITQLTRDHSWVADRVRQGILTELEAKNHSWRNVITNALGATQEVTLDLSYFMAQAGDKLFLCSDGISILIDDEELAKIITDNNSKDAVEKIMLQAYELGSPDNITAIAIDIKSITNKSKGYRLPDNTEPEAIKIDETRGGLTEISEIYPLKGIFAIMQKQPWYPFRYWLLASLGLFLLFLIFSLR